MRLANVDGRAALVVENGTLDVATATSGRLGPEVAEVLGSIDELRSLAPSLSGPVEPFELARLGPPSPSPGQIIAIGMNYREHAEEMGLVLPELPAAFAKFRSALTGPSGQIVLPSADVDYEVEMVLIIGRRTVGVTLESAWSHVAGLTAGQDLSERTVQMAAGRQFSLGKSFPGFAPIGPWLVTVDEFDDPNDLALGCAIDGVTVQDSRTSDMVFSVPELLVALSAVITLEVGDVLFTGSPAGVGMSFDPPRYLRPGQELTTWIEGSGVMRHQLIAPAPKTAS